MIDIKVLIIDIKDKSIHYSILNPFTCPKDCTINDFINSSVITFRKDYPEFYPSFFETDMEQNYCAIDYNNFTEMKKDTTIASIENLNKPIVVIVGKEFLQNPFHNNIESFCAFCRNNVIPEDWLKISENHFKELAKEFELLRNTLITTLDPEMIKKLIDAQKDAQEQNQEGVKKFLKESGNWLLDATKNVTVELITSYVNKLIGLN